MKPGKGACPTSMSSEAGIRIVEYEAKYQQAFKRLNEEWITRWFKMEEADYKLLDSPQESIVNMGGHILIALCDDEPVGTCALIKLNEATYELAKMSVSAQFRRRGIGFRLGQACITNARSIGASLLHLETHSSLHPAIALYRKLGFQEVKGATLSFVRCDLQMELALKCSDELNP